MGPLDAQLALQSPKFKSSMDSSANDVDAMSVKELKALITKAGLVARGLLREERAFRLRAREALAKTAAAEEEESEEDEIEDSDDDSAASTKPVPSRMIRSPTSTRC